VFSLHSDGALAGDATSVAQQRLVEAYIVLDEFRKELIGLLEANTRLAAIATPPPEFTTVAHAVSAEMGLMGEADV